MDKKKLIFFAIGLVALFGLTFIPQSADKETILTVVVVVFMAAYFFIFRKKVSEKEKKIKAKIEHLKNEGNDLALEQEADFSEQDLNLLYKRKRLRVLLYVSLTLFFCVILIGAIQLISDIGNKLLWQSTALIIILGGLGWIFIRDIQKLSRHILTGKKTIVHGIVTNKRIEGDETDIYLLEIDSLSIRVKKKVYDKYEIGNGIEVHILKPAGNLLLYESKIESMSLK